MFASNVVHALSSRIPERLPGLEIIFFLSAQVDMFLGRLFAGENRNLWFSAIVSQLIDGVVSRDVSLETIEKRISFPDFKTLCLINIVISRIE